MLKSPSIYFLDQDQYLTESSYEKLAIIDECYSQLNEDLGSQFTVTMSLSYTKSMVYEILENIKNTLMKLYQHLIMVLNNYIFNSANLVDKYRNLIIDRFDKLQEPFVYETYQYTGLYDKNYPRKINTSTLEKEITELQTSTISDGLSVTEVSNRVDKLLREFSDQVIGDRVKTDQLKVSVQKIVHTHIEGREQRKVLKKEDLNKFIDELKQYKTMKDEINRTKTELLTDYETLKRVYSNKMKSEEAKSVGLKSLKDPEVANLDAAEYQRFGDINMNMTRLFNGYLTIYSETYNTKLLILKNKIDANRNVINELMARTGVLATLNTKTPSQRKKPLSFDPKIKF